MMDGSAVTHQDSLLLTNAVFLELFLEISHCDLNIKILTFLKQKDRIPFWASQKCKSKIENAIE